MSKASKDKACPITAWLNYYVAVNDQFAATAREKLLEISLGDGMLCSELLESTLALIYKSWQMH